MPAAQPRRRQDAFLDVDEVSARQPLETIANHPTCPRCAFAEALTETRWLCRRHPPVVNPSRPGENMWPMVGPLDWCGDFSQ